MSNNFDILLPRNLNSGDDEPEEQTEQLRYMDWRMGSALPLFGDDYWPLSAVVCWIQDRTPEAVDGWTVDERQLANTLGEIWDALRAGDVRAHGKAGDDPNLREIPRASWFAYVLAYENRTGLIYLHVVPDGAEAPDGSISEIYISRHEVLRRWPSSKTEVPPSSAGAEHECKIWIASQIRSSPDHPIPKDLSGRKRSRGSLSCRSVASIEHGAALWRIAPHLLGPGRVDGAGNSRGRVQRF
jgi:hypothetical protein